MEKIYIKEILAHAFNKTLKNLEKPLMYSPEEFKIGLLHVIDTLPSTKADFKALFMDNTRLLQTHKDISESDIKHHMEYVVDYGVLKNTLPSNTNISEMATEMTEAIINAQKSQSPRLNQDAISRFNAIQLDF